MLQKRPPHFYKCDCGLVSAGCVLQPALNNVASIIYMKWFCLHLMFEQQNWNLKWGNIEDCNMLTAAICWIQSIVLESTPKKSSDELITKEVRRQKKCRGYCESLPSLRVAATGWFAVRIEFKVIFEPGAAAWCVTKGWNYWLTNTNICKSFKFSAHNSKISYRG